MDAFKIINILSATGFDGNFDDDFSDRLNYKYTVGILIVFSIVITTRQYGSEVIKCWVPAHFTSNYEQYVSQICWTENTYYLNSNQNIPKSGNERSKSEIKYYQWVQFILLLQALLFYLPRIFWNTFSVKAGLSLTDLMEAAYNYRSAEKIEKQPIYMNYLVKNIDQYVDDRRRSDVMRDKDNKISKFLRNIFPCFGRFLGNYIVILYLIVKLIYILNNIFQMFIISMLLEIDFWRFGFNFIINIFKGESWIVSSSKYFPKVTLCDFMIREIGNPNKSHRYTVQCVLPINLFNQQIFSLIWFCYVFVLLWNIVNIGVWFQRCLPIRANRWIKKRVYLFNKNVETHSLANRLEHFLSIYLEPDGIFIIRMIANNTSDYVANDLIHHLWCQHHEIYGSRFENEPHEEPNIPCLFDHNKSNHLCSCKHNESKINAQFKMNFEEKNLNDIQVPLILQNKK